MPRKQMKTSDKEYAIRVVEILRIHDSTLMTARVYARFWDIIDAMGLCRKACTEYMAQHQGCKIQDTSSGEMSRYEVRDQRGEAVFTSQIVHTQDLKMSDI